MKSNDKKSQTLEEKISQLGLNRYKRHIIFCAGDSCCPATNGELMWQRLKQASIEAQNKGIFWLRTKALCLRICQRGAVAVVYPDAVWYADLDMAALEEVIESHLNQGKVVQKYRIK